MKHGYATFKSPHQGMKEGLWDSNVLKNLEDIESYDPNNALIANKIHWE